MWLCRCSSTLVALVSLLPLAVTGQALPAPEQFYPYGPGVGDSTAPVNDDGSTDKIPISTLFPYFDERHDSLYVNTNGLISFLRSVSQYTPNSFPLDGKRRLVAAFWADVDTTENSGRAYYRELTDKNILERASRDVRRAFVRLTHFVATWVFIASWHKVTYYGGSSRTSVNTFQIVLITNGRHSFTILNYGDISWTTGTASGGSSSGKGGTPAQVGFNAGDGRRYFSVPGSRQNAIVDVETTTNVGLPGRWMFRVDDVDVEAGGCNTGGSLAVGPRFGPMLGGLVVTVSGPCFDDLSNKSAVVCKFIDVETPADVIDATRAQCVLPMMLRTGRIPLALSTDGGKTYNHTGVFYLVGDYNRETVSLVNRKRITWDDVGITWPQSYFNDTVVDIDFVSFSYDKNQNIRSLVTPLVKSVANVGRFTLPTRPRAATVSKSELVGSVRVRVADVTGSSHVPRRSIDGVRYEKSLWSDIIIVTRQLKNDVVEWFHRIPEEWCLNWYGLHAGRPSSEGLPACPCTRTQANVDNRFKDDAACSNGGSGCDYFHHGAFHCVRSVAASSLGAGQQCCYDKSGDIITDFDKGGGTFDRAHSDGNFRNGVIKIYRLSHFLDDVLPFFYCCKWSTTHCAKYGEMRPTDDCKEYVPPPTARTFGDPHIITFDGLHYTFNGLGEFWLIRSTHFHVQGRATQARNTRGDLVKGTWWTALAMRLVDIGNVVNGTVVQAQVNERTGLDVFVDGVKQNFDDLPSQDWSDVSVTYDAANMTADFRFYGGNEYALEVKIVDGALYYSLTWPRDADVPFGLLGNANGNIDDDLQTPDHVSLATNVTARQLYEFGLTWRTSVQESLFKYDAGSSHASFIDPSFEPMLEIPPTDDATMENVTQMCGGAEECVFDYLVTGKLIVALASADVTRLQKVFVEASKQVISCGHIKTPSNGTKNGSSPLVGSVATFTCNDGFRLEGSAQRMCSGQGKWNGTDVSCVADPKKTETGPGGSDKGSLGIIVGIFGAAVGMFIIMILIIVVHTVRTRKK